MTQFESLLIAYGTPPDQARRLAWGQDVLAFRNRELAAYGQQYEAEQIADAAPSTDVYERG